uniref:CSON010753 protein n=1 Tax=Culicoides sonorensis TaxID=179676 RepID=A0A336M2D9_CULSO
MALVKTFKEDEIPKGAAILSKKEALEYQIKLIDNWPSKSEVWPLKYSSTMLGITSTISSIYVNNHFRRKLKLMNFNKFSSYLPNVVLPAIMTTLFHANLATRNFTFRLPSITENPKELLKIAGKMFKPIRGHITGFVILNAFIAGILTYKEFESFLSMTEKIQKEIESEFVED